MPPAAPSPAPRRFADLKTRILSAVAAAAIGVGLLYLGGIWSGLLVTAACGAMAWEWRSVTRHQGRGGGIDAAPMVAAVAAAVLTQLWSGPAAGVVLLLGLCLAAAMDLVANRRDAAGWSLLGGLYIGCAGLSLLYLRLVPVDGFRVALWLLIAVAAADIGGYFAGRLIGGPKLWPRVSPKKTWAGSIGGILLAVICGGGFAWAAVDGAGAVVAGAVSALVAVVSQAGDLAESALKRHFGVKDSGVILPGHGGALDRFDGLIAAAIAVAVVAWLRGGALFG